MRKIWFLSLVEKGRSKAATEISWTWPLQLAVVKISPYAATWFLCQFRSCRRQLSVVPRLLDLLLRHIYRTKKGQRAHQKKRKKIKKREKERGGTLYYPLYTLVLQSSTMYFKYRVFILFISYASRIFYIT